MPAGQEVIVETTTDLNAWSEAQRVTGLDTGTPVKVTAPPRLASRPASGGCGGHERGGNQCAATVSGIVSIGG